MNEIRIRAVIKQTGCKHELHASFVGNSSQKLKFYIICNSVWWVKLP